MDSIYGGRPGSPFVIKARFSSIEEMQKAFKKGPDYKDVWYGEYCIIDTDNKNDFDNGKIYQRGTEYGNDTGDAKYVGQVVGPQSGVPAFDFASIDDITTKYTTGKDFSSGETRTWPYYDEESKKTDLYQDYAGKQGNRETIKINSFNTNNGFVAGWTTDNDGDHFVDDIQYTWVNIAYPYGTEENNKFAVSKTLVGFKAPYPVFKATVTDGDPYTEPRATVIQSSKTQGHPFAYQWDFTIPGRKKGDSVSLSATKFEPGTDNSTGTKITQTITSYEKSADGESTTSELCTINEIVDVKVNLEKNGDVHLYILFSDKTRRNNDEEDEDGKFKHGIISDRYGEATKALSWFDLGSIKDQSGILVGRDLNKDPNFSSLTNPTKEDIISTLNTNYTKANNMVDGKVCTYRDKEENTWFFAWDYNKNSNGWYYVGAFGGGGTKFSVSEGGDNAPKEWYFKKAEQVIFYEKKNWWDRGEIS